MNLLVFSEAALRHKLDGLRTELADLAFDLDQSGRCDAADVANMLRVRLGELTQEIVSSRTDEITLAS